MRRAALIDVMRTPFGKGKEGGALSSVHPVDLYAKVITVSYTHLTLPTNREV